METVANAVAGVDQDGEAQRQIGFGGEFDDGLRLLVFEDLEIALGEIGDEAALFVRDGEEHVDARDVEGDAGSISGVLRRCSLGVVGLAGEQEREGAESDDGVQLSTKARKTERGAKQFLTGLLGRAAPFALLHDW